MAIDLLGLAKGYLTSEVLGKVSSYLGESPTSTKTALDGVLPVVMGGLIKGASTEGGAATLLRTIQQGGFDGSLLGNLGNALGGGAATQSLASTGEGLLGSLLGNNLGSIVTSLAGSSGLKSSSVSSLLSLAAPLVFNLIGKQVSSQGLNAAGLMNLLMGQKDIVSRALPAGLGSVLNLGSLGHGATSVSHAAEHAVAEADGGAKWLWPLLIAGALALGLFYFLKGSGEQAVETAKDAGAAVSEAATNTAEKAGDAAATVGEAAATATTAVADAAKTLAKVTLPGGVSLDVEEGSIGYNLYKFLDDKASVYPKTFVFDHLNFNTGSAAITADSQVTVDNLAAILKAYPWAQARLEGHTDNVGNADSNKKLSVDRAAAVKAALEKAGVEAARLDTAGWGSEKPVASNETDEGRAQNRRTELVVSKK